MLKKGHGTAFHNWGRISRSSCNVFGGFGRHKRQASFHFIPHMFSLWQIRGLFRPGKNINIPVVLSLIYSSTTLATCGLALCYSGTLGLLCWKNGKIANCKSLSHDLVASKFPSITIIWVLPTGDLDIDVLLLVIWLGTSHKCRCVHVIKLITNVYHFVLPGMVHTGLWELLFGTCVNDAWFLSICERWLICPDPHMEVLDLRT